MLDSGDFVGLLTHSLRQTDAPARDRRLLGKPTCDHYLGLPVYSGYEGLNALLAAWSDPGPLGRLALAVAMLPALPLLVAAILGAGTMGLFVIAPAIGTRYDTLTYNTVTVFLTLFTGALIPRGTHGVFDLVGTVMPLTNAMDGVRSVMSGGPWLAAFGAELLVACAWGLVAAVTFALMDRRGLRTGQGAFEGS